MSVSPAHKDASKRWNESRDCITLRPEKEVGAKIRAAAKAKKTTIQKYVLAAVDEYMANEK